MNDNSGAVWVAKNNNEWTSAENWSDGAVPSATAVFQSESAVRVVAFPYGSSSVIDIIWFNDGAPGMQFKFNFPVAEKTPALKIAGTGVISESKVQQKFVVASSAKGYDYPQLEFTNNASAGNGSVLYQAGPTTPDSAGGGVIRFLKNSNAGSAAFVVTTGAGTPPRKDSTVGAEVSFADTASASSGTFTIWGSTSLTDGDTFGNVVFHGHATAENAAFINKGGTVPGGDGGNTQFYNNSNSGNGTFHNEGGTKYGQLSVIKDGKIVPKTIAKDGKTEPAMQGANGGDVAFDGTATGAHGKFHNYPGVVEGANGGVTSFNNNPPNMDTDHPTGADAGYGMYNNYGASETNCGGGGHTYFTAKHGSPSAAYGTFNNYGSSVAKSSSAGHTVFSITEGTDGTSTSYGDAKPTGKPGSVYFPTAANGTFWNHSAATKEGAAGYTEFTVYPAWGSTGSVSSNGKENPYADRVPTAGNGTFHNLSGKIEGAAGGVTKFYKTSRAGSSTLIAYGDGAGEAGQIEFGDDALGESASIQLHDGGVLSLSYLNTVLSVETLSVVKSGEVRMHVGSRTTALELLGQLSMSADAVLYFSFYVEEGVEPEHTFQILRASNLSDFSPDQFKGYEVQGMEAHFEIEGDVLHVTFTEKSETTDAQYHASDERERS